MQELDHKSIMDTLSLAMFVASPVSDESGKIYDFKIEYTNPQFVSLVHDVVQPGMFYSQFKNQISPEVPWFEIATQVMDTRYTVSQTINSQLTQKWIHITVNSIPSGGIVATLQDVSAQHEMEIQLKQQNMRNASLTEELSLTRSGMRTKLESIQTLNQQLQFAAYHDTMTNLKNRPWFERTIAMEIEACSKEDRKIGIILLDLDNLKDINESGGHAEGDAIIRRMGKILRTFEDDRTTACRFAGDEFIVVRNNISSNEEMALLGYKLIHACNDEGIGVSGGITIFPDDSRNPADLLKFADMAMVEVKKNGKNSIYFFQKMMEEKFRTKLCIENKLNKALSDDLFMLYFQPQFDVLTGSLRGFEALLRWHDDELGWIRPDQFIPLAEETQLVIPLGEWVMETAIKTLARWERDFGFNGIISVNVSPIQFKKDDFIYNLKDRISKYGIKVEHFEIEITEGMFIDNVPDTVAKLNEIRSMGIGISLDDFGTGYSSLRYLQILPLTTLKIDKSFISNISEVNGVEANITESIVSLVSKMGLDTIAEGVETDSQLNMLKKFNCHNVQGFLKGKPMPVDLCERMLGGDKSAILTIKNETPESL
ncbi:MAG: GGDEF domain-containing protein [Treponema sp.]|nr:GGDEF domain-containing protein [Treponema sp.]